MTGNTKFMGFERDSRVVLERWGGQTIVDLGSEEAVKRLRKACYEDLPKNPRMHRPGFATFVFTDAPAIEARLDSAQAKKLRAFLSDLPPHLKDDTVNWWLEELDEAARAFDRYFDAKNEPGVDDGSSEGDP